MTYMEKFFELFKRDLKTERLEMRILEPTPENAKVVWKALKNENPEDFKYIRFSSSGKTPLPESEKETLNTLLKENEKQNCVNYCVYHDNKFIGFVQIIYWEKGNILEIGKIWFVKSSWGKGFATEINKAIEKITFSKTNIVNMGWQCYENNTVSKKSALHNGYKLVKKMNDTDLNCVRLVFMKQKNSMGI